MLKKIPRVKVQSCVRLDREAQEWRGYRVTVPHHALLQDSQVFDSGHTSHVAYGLFGMPEEGSLNRRFPEIQTTTVEEIIGLWKGH